MRWLMWLLILVWALGCNTSGEGGASDGGSSADASEAAEAAVDSGSPSDAASSVDARADASPTDAAADARVDALLIDARVDAATDASSADAARDALVDALLVDAAPIEDTSPADAAAVDAAPIEDAAAPEGGRFTGNPLLCDELPAMFGPPREALQAQFDPEWFDTYNAFIAAFEDDEGLNPDTGRAAVMVAALLEDNVYPYCIPALELAEAHPDNPMYLNGAAVCLIRLEALESAGALLDCAYEAAPELFVTFENAAAWFHAQGMVEAALDAKAEACALAPTAGHCEFNGAGYAAQNGHPEDAEGFRARLPSNYPWDNGDGTSGGGGEPRTGVCCNCTDKIYDDVMVCVDECHASLGCFTGICTPNVECCGNNSPFTLGIQFCFPPSGPIQACIAGDTGGNLDVSVQASLGSLVTVGVRGRLTFTGDGAPSTSVGVYGNVASGAVGVDLDVPSGKVSRSVGVSFGGVGFSLGLPDGNLWEHIAPCL